METDETLLPQDISAKLTALIGEMRTGTAGCVALQVKLIAMRLFAFREMPPTRKRQKRARRIYHEFEQIRRRLADDRTLDGQEVLEPARDCIADLIDLARDTMDAKNQH